MTNLARAVENCLRNPISFCKFISANDAGSTGAHQSGFYIPLDSWSILFETPGAKGANKDKFVTIKWQDDFETDSRLIYYGQGTRNEYRITRFGRGFPFLNPDHVGDLFVLIQISSDYYHAYIIESDDEIESFLSSLNLSATQTNRLIDTTDLKVLSPPTLEALFQQYIQELLVEFPETILISRKARELYHLVYGNKAQRPDNLLLNWLETEYSLFKAIENDRYKQRISSPFDSVEELVMCANTMLNRRKSRAGKSLEHHLAEMFQIYQLQYGSQVVTEANKKPDFIFPGGDEYHDQSFNRDKLVFLGVKTTCKDRWRQILNESEVIKQKHLFTLQQGISENQLAEMYRHDVVLVVPKPYVSSFPGAFRDKIMTLEGFMSMVRTKCYN